MGEMILLVALAMTVFGLAGWCMWTGASEWGYDGKGVFFAGVVVALFGIGGLVALAEDRDDPHIMLNETEWACTESDTIIMPVMVGKVIVNQVRRVCTQYSRGA